MTKGRVFAITGIDTDIGKTVFTGLLAKGLLKKGVKVITAKAVQTGCTGISEDILCHREMMELPVLDEDREGTTCPYVYTTPCSPHLAANLENKTVVPQKIVECIEKLRDRYEIVLLEGAGGLFVPLTTDLLMIDFFKEAQWPVLMVSSARLGSLNHTIANLEALNKRSMNLAGIVYNHHGQEDVRIVKDSLEVIKEYRSRYGYTCPVVEMKKENEQHDLEMLWKLTELCQATTP